MLQGGTKQARRNQASKEEPSKQGGTRRSRWLLGFYARFDRADSAASRLPRPLLLRQPGGTCLVSIGQRSIPGLHLVHIWFTPGLHLVGPARSVECRGGGGEKRIDFYAGRASTDRAGPLPACGQLQRPPPFNRSLTGVFFQRSTGAWTALLDRRMRPALDQRWTSVWPAFDRHLTIV